MISRIKNKWLRRSILLLVFPFLVPATCLFLVVATLMEFLYEECGSSFLVAWRGR